MKLQNAAKIKEGLWRFTAPHPEWKPEKGGAGGWEQTVASVYFETSGSLVLIDPLAPPEGTPEADLFWASLDADVARLGFPVVILLANRYHVRSSATLYERYKNRPGCEVFAHEGAKECVKGVVTRWFHGDRELPAGVRSFPLLAFGPDEVAFYLPEHDALVVADAILGAGRGTLRVAPKAWAPLDEKSQANYDAWFRSEVRSLLDLSIEIVLVSHGAPVLAHGHAALVDALANPAWGK